MIAEPTLRLGVVTLSYLLAIAGSCGLVLYDRSFGLVTSHFERDFVPNRRLGLNARQWWDYSWGAIIAGTVGQLVTSWWVAAQ